MKNKIIWFISIFIVSLSIVGANTTYAAAFTINPDDWENIIYIFDSNYGSCLCVKGGGYWYINNGDMRWGAPMLLGVAPGELSSDNYMSSGYGTLHNVSGYILIKGSIEIGQNNNFVDGAYNSFEEYENASAPTWWERVAQIFTDFATSPAMGAVLSGDWLGYINEVLFGELWSVQVGEGEDELAQFYTVSATPSPSPTPIPTQIPVQVNIDPNTGNVTYHYTIDVSGTPVPTSSPINPNPPVVTGGIGSELTEPFGVTDYYEPDDSLSIPNLRIFQFQLDLPGSYTDIGVDSLDNNVEVMNGYIEDNADAITTVSSFFQVIPSDWFLLLGAIACFPIIAAMIKSLLGG